MGEESIMFEVNKIEYFKGLKGKKKNKRKEKFQLNKFQMEIRKRGLRYIYIYKYSFISFVVIKKNYLSKVNLIKIVIFYFSAGKRKVILEKSRVY